MHQAAEYLIGGAFVASGLQSPKPIVPTLMGALIMLNTACSKGPLSAFRVFGKRFHRMLDASLIVLTLVASLQPVVSIDNGTRGIMVLLALCMGVIWLQSDFAERPPSARAIARSTRSAGSATPRTAQVGAPGTASTSSARSSGRASGAAASATQASRPPEPDGSTADTIGRTAGRLAGKGVNLYRARKASQKSKP